MLERQFQSEVSHDFIVVSSIWMGFIFYVFFLFLSYDISIISFKLFNIKINQETYTPFIIFFLSLVICIYAYYEANNIKITTIDIPNHKTRINNDSFNIVQISDVHLGILVGNKKLQKITDMIKKINPDLLVITGDLLDKDVNHIEELYQLLADVKPKYGKYAVTGNHEFYVGIDKSILFMKNTNITLLRNQVKIIPGIMNIVGIDDPAVKIFDKSIDTDLSQTMKDIDKNLFTLLLYHQPKDYKKAQELGVDLQLSGHTHNGQLFPFNLFVSLSYPIYKGLHKFNDFYIYISRGTGTWGPPMRFLSPPEITWIKVRSWELRCL
ncbi:MAG: metallophosphoesterase [Candidatus Firestonebacteria bacterium]|nr:metallophosphoesterase [Candidatus Firestonebacteria bacterium]